MTDTPRTDEYMDNLHRNNWMGDIEGFARELERKLARVTKERDEWMAKANEWEPRLISFDSSEIKIKAAHEVMKNLVCMFAELNKDAKNYTESLIEFKAYGKAYIVTVRNKDGKTPHELRMEAEKERDACRDWLRAYLGEIEQIAKPHDIVRLKSECGL